MSAGHPFDAPLASWIEAETGLKGARVSRALSGGNANLTLLLATDDGPLVLRTPPENAISATSHRGIEREATVLRAIQGHVKAPRVVGWCEDAAVIGRPFLLVSHVDGEAITDTLPATYPATAASVNRLGEDLIDELAAIHRAPWQTIGLERLGNPQSFLERQITRWRAARAESPARDLPL
ncbi:MAG TPA: phosphotransferase family protein, partial [Haliea salexigens]|nr:phosphotransferase family protein [Haliea salexigens]